MKKGVFLVLFAISGLCGQVQQDEGFLAQVRTVLRGPETISKPNGQVITMEQAKAQFLNGLKQANLSVEDTKGLHNALSALRNNRMGLPRLTDKSFQFYRFAKELKAKMPEADYKSFLDFALENTQIYSIEEADIEYVIAK